ncbi:MAG: GNAT family N-acetyltransferase [Flavobacteriales bacterium]
MTQNTLVIREIKKEDNSCLETIIKSVFPEFNIPLVGTAYQDVETTSMYQSYQGDKQIYYVIEKDGIVCGGAGIKPLKNFKDTCELQKMYFDPAIRGKGYGDKIINKCLLFAKKTGYKSIYLETAPQLKAAIHLYKKKGFHHLDAPLGNTGHFSCTVYMLKDL